MYKQPLFGEDSSPHITSMLVSAIVTLICWIVFCVLCLVIKFKPKAPQYKEVQIVLSSTPVVAPVDPEPVEGQAESAAATMQEEADVVPEPVEGPQEEAVVEQKPVETPKAKTVETKQPAAKTKTTPPPKQNYTKVTEPETYGTFLDDEIDFGTKKNSAASADWDNMNFTENQSNEEENSQRLYVSNSSGYSGNQGNIDSDNSAKKASDIQQNNPSYNNSPSEETLKRLKAIKTSYKKSYGDVDSIVTAETTKSNGYVNIKLSDGSTRALIEPLTPVITLSPEAANAIENTVTVRIKFYVLPVGNVQSGRISILYQNSDNSAESLLPSVVRNEINNQLKNWVFEPGSSEAYAIFELTIKKQ